jgi:hypothetical protein
MASFVPNFFIFYLPYTIKNVLKLILWRTLFAHQWIDQLVQYRIPFSPAMEETILILVRETQSFWVSVPVGHSWATALRKLTPASAFRILVRYRTKKNAGLCQLSLVQDLFQHR